MPSDAFEILEWIVNAFAGWRYLFSRSFRQRTHARWKSEGRVTAFIDILFGGSGVLLTLVLLWLLVSFLSG